MRRGAFVTGLFGVALIAAGCGTSSGTGTTAATAPARGGAATAPSVHPGSVLSSWTSPLGAVVIDDRGRTVYVFDKDTSGSGTSACTGACASLWPAVTTTSATPAVSGVTGKVGTISRSDGVEQVTLDGHPSTPSPVIPARGRPRARAT